MHDNVKLLPGGRPGENRPAIEGGYDIDAFIVYGSNNKHLVDNLWVHDVAPVHIPALRCRDMMIDDNGDYNVFNQVSNPLLSNMIMFRARGGHSSVRLEMIVTVVIHVAFGVHGQKHSCFSSP